MNGKPVLKHAGCLSADAHEFLVRYGSGATDMAKMGTQIIGVF
jgi:hypothetical protein